MADFAKDQNDALACIDAVMAFIEKYPKIDPKLTIVAPSPFAFLIDICKRLGIYDEMENFIIKMLTSSLPVIETAVKAILLSNLKALISCTSDARIPDNIRQANNIGFNSTDSDEKGLFFNIQQLDYNNMLSISPLSDRGKMLYFGTEGMNNTMQLARARDFNAFLWFVINKANFPSPTILQGELPQAFNALNQTYDRNNLFGEGHTTPTNGKSGIVVGNSFVHRPTGGSSQQDISNVFNICIDAQYDENGNILGNTLVPVSNNWKSAHWYVDSGTYFDYLKPESERKPRDYSKEYPIINLRYLNINDPQSAYNNSSMNQLQITVLPKPYVHLPRNGEPTWRIQTILFNADGEPDKNGKFSVRVDKASVIGTDKDSPQVTYNLLSNGGRVVNKLIINKNDGTYQLENTTSEGMLCLYECYPGLTVYKLNYDLVMGMQLFDAKTITANLLNIATYSEIGVCFSLSINEIETQLRVSEIIKNVIESDGSTVSDCFFSFSNDQIAELSRQAELKYMNQEPFLGDTNTAIDFDMESVQAILNQYNSQGTLEENVDVLKRTFAQVTANITEEIPGVIEYNIHCDIVMKLLQGLVTSIVNAVLSPKILLLFEINRQILGDDGKLLSFEELLNMMMNVITSIVKEIVDLILQELLQFVLAQLQPLFELLASKILMEQLKYYKDMITLMLKACKFNFGNKSTDPNRLDEVNYADIDTPPTQPQTSECS